MRTVRRLWTGLRALVQKERAERELGDELNAYLDETIEQYVSAGMSPDAAVRAARREIGNITAIKDSVRDVGWESHVERVWQDMRYAVRTLRRSPAFTMTALVILALGIGATTAVFSLINGLLVRELPVTDPHQLVTISSPNGIRQGRLAGFGWSYPMWERLRDRAQAFDGAFVWMPQRLNLATAGDMELVDVVVTTSDFFSTLGVRALLGRTFTADDDRRGGGHDGPATVISHAFWHRHLAGAPDVIGMPLVIEGVPFTIVGVTPAGFVGVEVGRSFDIALTLGTEPIIRNGAAIDEPSAFGLIPMLRLKSGQTIDRGVDLIVSIQREFPRREG
jgi:putative ABC transport system permease protein